MAVKSTIAPIHHGISRNVTAAIERLSTDPGAAAEIHTEEALKTLEGDVQSSALEDRLVK